MTDLAEERAEQVGLPVPPECAYTISWGRVGGFGHTPFLQHTC